MRYFLQQLLLSTPQLFHSTHPYMFCSFNIITNRKFLQKVQEIYKQTREYKLQYRKTGNTEESQSASLQDSLSNYVCLHLVSQVGHCMAMLFERTGLINYKDTKTKCRLYWYLIEFLDWRYSQSYWYFRPSFVNYWPSNLLSGSPPLPPPSPKSKYSLYTQCLAGRGGGGVLSCVGDNILQEINILFLARLRTYKIALPPQTKTQEGRGPQQINTCRKVTLQVNFFK